MRKANNYISLSEAKILIKDGYKFRQDMQQTWFEVYKGNDIKKLNKKTATFLKQTL